MPTPMEALLKASAEARKSSGLKPGSPVRLGEIKDRYFEQKPQSFRTPKTKAAISTDKTPAKEAQPEMSEVDKEALLRQMQEKHANGKGK